MVLVSPAIRGYLADMTADTTKVKRPTLAGAMSPFPSSISPEATLWDAREMMQSHRIHHLPVTHDGEILGVIRAEDLFLADNLAPHRAAETRVHAVYARDPYVVDIHTRLEVVARAMAERRCSSVIVTRRGKLAGILTHTDVCRVLADLLDELTPDPDRGRVA